MTTSSSTFVSARTGPRPLGLYLALLQPAGPTGHVATLSDELPAGGSRDGSPALLSAGVLAPATRDFLAGVKRYHDNPWRRELAAPEVAAQMGRVTLWNYGGDGPATVLVPSMINRAYIFDLLEGASMARHLVGAGHRVFLVDWGAPDSEPSDPLDMDTAVAGRLLPAVDKAAALTGGPVALVGYCMGGLLALAAARLAPAGQVERLVLAATPWDFAATPTHRVVNASRALHELTLRAMPTIPVDVLQTQFVLLDPMAAIRRMQAYAKVSDADQLARMTAIEDWLADGVALESAIARTVLFDWYGDNQPVTGTWQVAGQAVDARQIDIPALCILPQRDSIVPLAASQPLVEQLPQARVLEVPCGHIGLMAGRRAVDGVYKPVAEFLSL